MNAFLTAVAFVVLIAAAAYVIHRLNLQHADRIAVHRYSAPRPGHRGRGAPQPPVGPDRSEAPVSSERRDQRDGGRGRFPSRRRRTPHPR
ncbi:hypothetical protein K4B79_35940 [Streptomyces lincolnensis]|uniref:hypothetical protein n=1 Tax=Streptomyces lincolnensis TaxID=1915 RepID=UPI001E312C65|nr:hypothetical protein [Streptomyces lincolnensis]MCD7443590.1 hypothetical protein [Streptomyces lincolnensis]